MADKSKETNTEAQVAGEVSNLPLFYKQPMPLDAKKHGELSLKKKNWNYN